MSTATDRIEHIGTVVAVIDKYVQVQIEQQAACSSCGARTMCGTSEFKEKQIEALALTDMQVGDEVNVWGQQRLGTKAVMLAFVIPLVIMVAALVAFHAWIDNEALAGTLALLMLLPWCGVLYLMRDKLKREFVFYAERIA